MNNDENKISVKFAFDDIFGGEDKYFGEWFIESDDSLENFLNNHNSKEILIKQLRYLFLYFESLNVLKKQSESEEFTIARVYSKETWYCCVLLLLIGLIDQHTKSELNTKGKPKTQLKRFQIVMNSLIPSEKQHLLTHYNGGKFKKINDLTLHIYETRTFFAHEIILPEGSIPQDSFLGFSNKDTEKIVMFPNMPHGQIFLYIIIALVRYLGFKGELEISSNKKFDNLVDFLRKT
jgi:hypothetical protein